MGQLLYEFKSAASGYPKFIYFNTNLNSIPVFVYHTIDPKLFESHLIYLKENNYHSLSVDEFIEASKSGLQPKSVLLTIDDARSSVWRFAFPLLKKYEVNATIYIIPGLTLSADNVRDNLDDVWFGKTSKSEIESSDPNDQTLCTWPEIQTMYKSGLISIESHTLFHREQFQSLKIIDYITPDKQLLPYKNPASPYYSPSTIGEPLTKDNLLGLPLFESSPLMLAGPKLNISQEFISKCNNIYNNETKLNWKTELFNLVKKNSQNYFSFERESKNEVVDDLFSAREIIQNKLDRFAGNHLCLPWTIGNYKTISIIKEIGVKSCGWGTLPGKNMPFDPYYISRIKNDFIFRLPGRQRKNLFSIYNYKLKRRLTKEKIF